MKLYNQLCGKEQSIRLKELGVMQDSIYYYDRLDNIYMGRGVDKIRLSDFTTHNGTTVGGFFSAYTVAEMIQILSRWRHSIGKYPNGYCVTVETDTILYFPISEDLSTTICYPIIYLLENNHTTPEEVNQRLNSN